MLTQMSLTNFKSWQETGDIRLAPLTGFFGANSSGKSSLLQMLLMLKATTESSDRNVLLETRIRDYVPMGVLQDLVHRKSHQIGASIEWDLPTPIGVGDLPLTKLNFSVNFFRKDRNDVESPFYLGNFSYGLYEQQGEKILFSAQMKSEDKGGHYTVEQHKDNRLLQLKSGYMTETRVKSYGFPPEVWRHYQDVLYLQDFAFALEEHFKRVYHLGPLRALPLRLYEWAGDKPSDIGRTGERAVSALLAEEKIIPDIARWYIKMNLATSFEVKKIIGQSYQVRLNVVDDDYVLLSDMGFGISQVLPVLVACYYIPEGSTLLIEQPEMHLHPSAQSVLADMFIEIIQQRKVQLIIESHSEHLLARLQRRMAEQKLDVNDTAFYFCRLEDGVSHIETLQLDQYGEIKNYPHDFFGDLTGDVFERAKASIEQRMGLVTE